MTIPVGLCSKCHEDFYHCRCTQFYPNLPIPHIHTYEYKEGAKGIICTDCFQYKEEIENPDHTFELKEVQALYRILEHQFIDVEDSEARAVVDRIAKIVEGN